MANVPCELIATILERELPKYAGSSAGLAGRGETLEFSPSYNMAARISRTTGKSVDTVLGRIKQIRQRKYKTVEFQTVDYLLTGLGLPHLWRCELRQYYRAPRQRQT